MNKDFIVAVQRLMQSHGEPLQRFGADGDWGSESKTAFERLLVGAPQAAGLPDGYLDVLAQIESGGRDYVKAQTSSASGRYQFIRSTWEAMGGSWGTDSSKAFGGLSPSRAEQDRIVTKFTLDNVRILQANGIAINAGSLYAAHFLGVGTAAKVLKAPDTARADALAGAAATKANPSILAGKTVGQFKDWLKKKTGTRP